MPSSLAPSQEQNNFKILLIVFKCFNNMCPLFISNRIVKRKSVRSLRNSASSSCEVPFTRSTLVYDRSFSHAAPRLWNELPIQIRNAESVVVFKGLLKTHLFTNFFND